MKGPLLTATVNETLRTAAREGMRAVECSLDLQRSISRVEVDAQGWAWEGHRYPYLDKAQDRTIYHWSEQRFQPVSRYTVSLIKLVPTEWGPPTFEIDGIKMLPTSRESPYADAERKVRLIRPRGKIVLDTCGGLGYFAACCLDEGAAKVLSYEKNADVIWLRTLNPWSPQASGGLSLMHADITQQITGLATASLDAALHDPPRFGIAGELYSQAFYDQLARVLKPKGSLFHYTGAPNKLTTNRDVPNEVSTRLRRAGFTTASEGDGVLAVKSR